MGPRNSYCRAIYFAIAVLLLQACAHSVRPGAVDQADSRAFDVLGTAAITIEAAKQDFTAGRLPASAKPKINAMVDAYDAARASWLTYRDVIRAGRGGDPEALNRALAQVLTTITEFAGKGGKP
jgi:type IV pilus biogenesis protein CpaD/CtpE